MRCVEMVNPASITNQARAMKSINESYHILDDDNISDVSNIDKKQDDHVDSKSRSFPSGDTLTIIMLVFLGLCLVAAWKVAASCSMIRIL